MSDSTSRPDNQSPGDAPALAQSSGDAQPVGSQPAGTHAYEAAGSARAPYADTAYTSEPSYVPATTASSAPPASAASNRRKRWLQTGAVGIAGLVAGSALTFAVTANGATTATTQQGPGGMPGYGRMAGGPPGGFGNGQAPGTTQQDGGTTQTQPGQTIPDQTVPDQAQPSSGSSTVTG